MAVATVDLAIRKEKPPDVFCLHKIRPGVFAIYEPHAHNAEPGYLPRVVEAMEQVRGGKVKGTLNKSSNQWSLVALSRGYGMPVGKAGVTTTACVAKPKTAARERE